MCISRLPTKTLAQFEFGCLPVSLHHCRIVNIRGNGYRMRKHQDLREPMREADVGDEPRQRAAP